MATYEEGYKRGVEDATIPIGPKEYESVRNFNRSLNEDITALFEQRRKKLLTKKVTKWINLYLYEGKIVTAESALLDFHSPEEEARGVVAKYPSSDYTTFIGFL